MSPFMLVAFLWYSVVYLKDSVVIFLHADGTFFIILKWLSRSLFFNYTDVIYFLKAKRPWLGPCFHKWVCLTSMGHTGGCWGGGSVVVAVVKTGLQLLPSEWQWFTAWSMHATPLRVARAAAAALAAAAVQPPPPTTESSYSSSSSAHYWTNTELQSDRSGGFRPRLRRRVVRRPERVPKRKADRPTVTRRTRHQQQQSFAPSLLLKTLEVHPC